MFHLYVIIIILAITILLPEPTSSQAVPACGRYDKDAKEYKVLKAPYNMGIDKDEWSSPDVIWMACDENDVLRALREAISLKAEVSVRAGGHNVEGYSSYAPKGGKKRRVLIDVYHLNGRWFYNPYVTFGAGVKVSEANIFMAAQTPAVSLPFTECGTVGVTGSSLGGGYGLLSRTLGLAADNIVLMRVAVIEGKLAKILVVSQASHPDLFWALRGAGGGNFGVVTQITYRAHPIPPVVTYVASGEARIAEARELVQYITTAPKELFYSMNIKSGRKTVIELKAIYMGNMTTDIEFDLTMMGFRRFDRYLPHEARIWQRQMNFCTSEADCTSQARNVPHVSKTYFKRKAIFVHTIDEAVRLINLMPGEGSDVDFIDLTPFNGQVAARGPTDTAFVHRDALFLVMMFKFWDDTERKPDRLRAGMKTFHDKVRGIVSRDAAYPNFIDRDLINDDWMTIFYGQNADRLRVVKSRYDPENIFSFPMSIPLAPANAYWPSYLFGDRRPAPKMIQTPYRDANGVLRTRTSFVSRQLPGVPWWQQRLNGGGK